MAAINIYEVATVASSSFFLCICILVINHYIIIHVDGRRRFASKYSTRTVYDTFFPVRKVLLPSGGYLYKQALISHHTITGTFEGTVIITFTTITNAP